MGGDWSAASHAELLAEVSRLNALLDERFKDLKLASAGPDGGGAFVFELRSGMAGLMAEHLAQILREEGAPNFVQIEAVHPELGPLTFTVERRFGDSPSKQLAEAKRRIAELEAQA